MKAIAALLACGLILASPSLRAETRMARVGLLTPGSEEPGIRRLVEALAALGYVEGRNFVFVKRAANGRLDRLPRLARELLAERPDVVITSMAPAARALAAATRDVPIVLAVIGDPIALHLTGSIARPTANVTGFMTGLDRLAPKRLQLMLELLPAARKIAVLWVRENGVNQLVFDRTREAAAALNVEILSLPISNEREISAALDRAEREKAAGLIVAADPLTLANRRSIIDGCFFRNLPAMHTYAFEVHDGGLIAYGTDAGEDFQRSAEYVDRLLKGAKIADLPFQEPAQIHLAVNLRAARAIGLTVPLSLVVRADEVIE